MKEVPGIANAKNAKPPNPKASPKDFVWPSQRDMDDKVAQKIAASLQELLSARGWKHTDLAKALYGTVGANEAPRNVGATRRYVVAEHPIPNETVAGYIAQILEVPMSRLLEPEGRFNPLPEMIRPRSDSPRFAGKAKKAAKKASKTPSGRDREKQRAYNAAYRARQRAKKKGKGELTYYMRKKLEKLKAKRNHAKTNGNGTPREDGAWILAEGLDPPSYNISSSEEHAGHVTLKVDAVLPHQRAMAILHILQHAEVQDEERS